MGLEEETAAAAGSENLTLEDEIAAMNERADAGEDEETAAAAGGSEEAEAEAGKGTDPGKEAPAAGADPPAEGAAAEVETGLEKTAEAAPAFVFTPELSLEDFTKTRDAFLETVDLSDVPEVTQIFEYYEKQLSTGGEAAAAAAAPSLEEYGGTERVQKTMKALDRLVETEIEGTAGNEKPVPNAKPIVELLKSDYTNEFSAIAGELFMSDSSRYRGASVFEEVLIDSFGVTPQQVNQVVNFLKHSTPLPQAVNKAALPDGIDEKLAEAFWNYPERKRYELESIAKEIAQIERDLPTMDDFYKPDANTKLADLKAKLADEVQTLTQLQQGIDDKKVTEATTKRQNQQDAALFAGELIKEYYGEIFELSENFSVEIAKQLDFLDEEMRLPLARDIAARIANALSFLYDQSDFSYVPDPTAPIYAAQLKSEGVKYDFEKGRELLHSHLLACRKIKVLKRTGGSVGAIEKAVREKNAIVKEIKAAQAELLGQSTARYVSSAGTALKKKVGELDKKRQITRKVVNTGGGGGRTADSPEKLAADLAAHNARIDAEDAEGDLADIVFDRKAAGKK